MKTSVKTALLSLLTASMLSCGKEDDTSGGRLPDVQGSSGQFVFKIGNLTGYESVSGYVVGKKDTLKLERASSGEFFISNVPAGKFDVIIVATQPNSLWNGLNLSDSSNGKGIRLAKVESIAGTRTSKEDVSLEALSSIIGKVFLSGQTNHEGIDAYIPGTSFSAKTAADGSFTISGVPAGLQNLVLDHQGYHKGRIEALDVKASQGKLIPDTTLLLSTGADGFLVIENGVPSIDSRTVNLTIGATSDAVLMKISESITFEGAGWKPLATSIEYTFSTPGQKTLFVMFADSNGLASSPYRSEILVSLFPSNVNLKLASGASTSNDPTISVSFDKPKNAKMMKIADSSNFSEVEWITTNPQTSFTFQNLGSQTLYLKFKDESDFESSTYSASITIQSPMQSFSSGWPQSCAITSSGSVKCFGINLDVQSIPSLTSGVVQIESGIGFHCALLNSGGVKCWGDNSYCQLGNGSTQSTAIPTDVQGLTSGVTKISIANAHQYQHVCAVLTDGQMKCWGANQDGQMGTQTTTNACTPVSTPGVSNVIATGGGNYHRCALTSSGEVLCWGFATAVGTGGPTPSIQAPQTVSGLNSGISALAVGGFHSCALTSSGGVRCWGANNSGQIGIGTSGLPALTPQDVTGLTSGVASLALSDYESSCAVLSTGTVKCWGRDYGLTNPPQQQPDKLSPVVLPFVYSPLLLSLSANEACFLKQDGSINCWGGTFGTLKMLPGSGGG